MSSTIAVDFDGVLHSYTSGWQGANIVGDPPVPGAIDWLNQISQTYQIAINSVRCATVTGRTAMYNWLLQHNVSPEAMAKITMPETKPQAALYVDDRAWRFEGNNFPSAEDVDAADPWWKSQS